MSHINFLFHADWLHNEIKLTALGKQNESIMKSCLSLSQNLADIQRELQLFLDRSSRSKSTPVNQQIEPARKCLNEVTQTRQKCIREIRECIRLSEDLVYREKQRWNFIHKLSDAQVSILIFSSFRSVWWFFSCRKFCNTSLMNWSKRGFTTDKTRVGALKNLTLKSRSRFLAFWMWH